MEPLNGLLLVDKPQDWTSFDVVAKIRGIIRRETGQKIKIGHTGTLDPMATGLLVLAVGPATKQMQVLMKHDKIYEATVALGKTSTTDDAWGELTDVSNTEPSLDQVEAALENFVGEIQQIPPAYSAIKVDGKRAYKSAREGKEVQLEPRTVTVRSVNDLKYKYPELSFVTEVSSGTYIRSLARDLGEKLGTGGYLSGLRRLSVGEFSVQGAIRMEGVNMESIRGGIFSLD